MRGLRPVLSGWTVIPFLVMFLWAHLGTTWEVTAFLLQRQRIERELCVMRDKAPEENKCHGQCYLMKRLQALQDAHEEPLAVVQVRLDPVVPLTGATGWLTFAEEERTFFTGAEPVCGMPPAPDDPVPWG